MILVTGATGFIGSELVKKLKQNGEKIRVLVRNNAIPDVENWKGDLEYKNSLQGISNGIDYVVHLAAYAELDDSSKKSERGHYRTNVQGLKNLLEECRNVKKFVFISSTAAMGQVINKKNLAFETGTIPKNPYGRTKRIGEEMVRKSGINHSIIRPGLVWKPFESKETKMILDWLKKGFMPVVDNGKYLTSIIKRDELVDIIINELYSKNGRTIYAVSETIPFREFIDRLAVSNRIKSIWIVKMPFILLSPIFWLMDIAFKLMNKKPPLSFERAYYLHKQDKFESKRGL